MITLEGKLSVFTKLVLGKARREFNEKQKEINTQNEGKIQKQVLRLKQESEKIVKEWVKKGELGKNKQISKANLDKKRQILNKKQELIARLVKNLERKALEFTQHDEYKDFLKDILSKVLLNFENDKPVTLFLTDRDLERYKSFILDEAQNYGFSQESIEMLVLEEAFIGGIIGVNKDRTFRINYSISSMIEEKRQWIGQKLYDEFDKAGGVNG